MCVYISPPPHRKLRSSSSQYSTLPAVRMSDLRDEVDSGIEDRGSDSMGSGEGSDSHSAGSDSHSAGSDSNSPSSSVLDMELGTDEAAGIGLEPGPVSVAPGLLHRKKPPSYAPVTLQMGEIGSAPQLVGPNEPRPTVEERLTQYVQVVLLRVVATPVMLPQIVRFSFVRYTSLRTALRWFTRLSVVLIFAVILAGMCVAMLQLKPANHPPQFFDPNSNIQKMLDLEGNLTTREAVNCWDCSAWYGGGDTGGGDTGGGGSECVCVCVCMCVCGSVMRKCVSVCMCLEVVQ